VSLALAAGALIGTAGATKSVAMVVLPFAALFALGSTAWPPARAAVARAGAVVAGALGTLLGLSFVSGRGLGWIGALTHAVTRRSGRRRRPRSA